MKDTTSLELFLTLTSATNSISKNLDRYLGALHGLGVSEFRVLHQLDIAPSNSLSRISLAELVGLTASGITRLLNPIEKIGLVEKQANQRDARISLVKLSASGKQLYNDALIGFDQVADKSLTQLSTRERTSLLTLVRKVS